MKSGVALPKGTCFPIRGKLISQKEYSSTFLTLFSVRKIDSHLELNLSAFGVTYCAASLNCISIIS
jgi:hypothetical protein